MQIEIAGAHLEQGKVVLECPNPWEIRKLMDLLGKSGTYDIDKAQELRSNKANAYMWALATQIADAVRITKEEVYQEAVKAVGPYRDFDPLPEDQASTLRVAWERLGKGWVTEQVDYDITGTRVIIRAYYGSSTYNPKRMGMLIDYLVEEARNLGLETYDDERITSLMEEYENEYQRIRNRAG